MLAMVDFLQQGDVLAKTTGGDQQAKLRSFGDALYDPWLKDDDEIVEFLRTSATAKRTSSG